MAFSAALVLAPCLVPLEATACPTDWVPAPGLICTNGQVYSIATLPGGDMVMGGTFTTAGGMPMNRVARFNPATNAWSALGDGIPGTNAPIVYAVVAISGGDIVAAGSFTTGNGAPANHIARYSPSTNMWTSLGTGVNSTVTALAVLPGGDVIVGGNMWLAGGVAVNNIARYSPSTDTWSAIGSGVSSSVLSLLTLPDGDVLVGGQFTTAGGVPANRIARLNPTTNTWSALGTGVTSAGPISVTALAVLPDGDFLIGGSFSTAGGVNALNVARYNPTAGEWSALGSGANSSVHSFAVLSGGDAVVGGGFSTIGGLNSKGIARYNFTTSTWSKLGSSGLNGVSDIARTLALTAAGDLVVGGNTNGGGGVPLNGMGLARFTFSNGCLADFDCSDGQATVPDIFAFLIAWFAADPAADLDGVPGIAVPDIFTFLAAWFAGCP